MRHVEVVASAPGVSCGAAYATICDFARYPEHSAAVRSVKVMTAVDGLATSAWEVNFRGGILRWTEEDRFNADKHTVHFNQIEGDIDYFAGHWSIGESPDGCVIRFVCDFDLGIPGLNDFLEPVAEQALVENTQSIIKGLIPSAEFAVASGIDTVGVA
jgi:ribosome-associated toxin RatA of RatAB toxin-antitoxin module